MTWWSDYRKVYFMLTTLGTPAFPVKNRQIIWSSDNISFKDKDIRGHFNEVEEQLWAERKGLS